MAAEGAQEVRARLEKAQFQKVREVTTGKVTWRSPSGHLVDVVESRAEWVPEALEHLGRDPEGLSVLALPCLVLMNVGSGRAQDLADAARTLGLAPEELPQDTRMVFQLTAASVRPVNCWATGQESFQGNRHWSEPFPMGYPEQVLELRHICGQVLRWRSGNILPRRSGALACHRLKPEGGFGLTS